MSNNVFTAPLTDEDTALERLHRRLERNADTGGLLDVAYRTIDTPVGTLLLAATTLGLVRVAYDVEDHAAVLAGLAESVSPRILHAPARLDAVARQIDEYFAKRRTVFDVPVDLRLAEGFRRNVIEHLRDIGYGQRETYADVALADRQPARGACRRHRVRPQSAARCHPVPSRGAFRRLDRASTPAGRTQGDAARPRSRLREWKRRVGGPTPWSRSTSTAARRSPSCGWRCNPRRTATSLSPHTGRTPESSQCAP